MMLSQRPAHEVVPTGVMRQVPRVLIPGSGGTSTFFGAEVSVETGATTYNDYEWFPDYPWTDVTAEAVENPAYIDVGDFPIIARAGGFTGVAQITLGNSSGKVAYSLNFANSTGATYYETTGAAAGSYLAYSHDVVEQLLSSGASKIVFLSGGTRNPDSWWPHSELTGIPYSNSTGGAKRNGALITPRHILCARHFPINVGATVRFVTSGNGAVDRTVLATAVPEVSTAPFYDLMVVVLSSDLPETITPLPVAGGWLCNTSENSSTTFNTASQFAGIWVDQNREAGFVDIAFPSNQTDFYSSETWDGLDLSTLRPTGVAFHSNVAGADLPSLDAYRATYKHYGVSGDSGSAVLVPVAGGWAVAACMLSSGSGPHPQEQILNKLILAADSAAGVSTGYTVTVAPDPTA